MTQLVAPSTHDKAYHFNLDSQTHGSFAEIGAGQEVARWFFQVGRAARTVAKTISAYDMAISDSLYGPAPRYVSRQRLEAMLEQEYRQLLEGLSTTRGGTTTFFAFADTIATRRPGHDEHGRGWVGMRFQAKPYEEPSQIILHVHLLEATPLQQQNTLGVLGVNLIYGAFYQRDDLPALVGSLMDGLVTEYIDIDLIKVAGPAFAGVDNRLLSLQLVEKQLTNAAMFTESGEVVQPSEVIYKRPILAVRGGFRPATRLTVDLIERARDQFLAEPEVKGKDPVILAEMTLNDLRTENTIRHEDFLGRAQMLHVLGIDVLITNFRPFYQLTDYLAGYTDQMIGIPVGVPTFRDILDEKFYEDLGGGSLEAVGRLFKQSVKMYVYPTVDTANGQIVDLNSVALPPPADHVRCLLRDTGRIEAVVGCDMACLSIDTHDVLARIQSGDRSWESMVPPAIAENIKEQNLFGYRPTI